MPGMMPVVSTDKLQVLELLAEKYPTIQDVCTEIINLQAILNLPKGTEHFISDIHGEYEAFCHILNNCSGVIREKVELLYGETLSVQERAELCTLIYYPEEKLNMLRRQKILSDGWYENTLHQLIELCRLVAGKYTRSKVRKALPPAFSYIIDELLHAQANESAGQRAYHKNIIATILNLRNAEEFITALAGLIKRLAVDRLHLVGDIYDRGPRADSVMELLTHHHSVDIQWGNHDILWMGAAAGSDACIATVVRNSMAYRNYAMLESGYGISLRPLFLFAEAEYPACATAAEAAELAISIMLFKLEGQIIRRHPEYGMEDRLLLDKIDRGKWEVELEGGRYPLDAACFSTVDPLYPYELTPEEQAVLDELRGAFADSERLHRHIAFLYAHGGMYRIFNQNLLFHGCIPMTEDGRMAQVEFGGRRMAGRALLDYYDAAARRAYFGRDEEEENADSLDMMWYLWCGKLSPLFGRSKMTTFERMFIREPAVAEERKNPYYRWCNEEPVCEEILRDFGIVTPYAHIINGHVPVRAVEGESPVKANGRLIVIDGGLCRAYQPTTGIAGYTLIFNSQGMRILSHQPFGSLEEAVREDRDIRSHSFVFETGSDRMLVRDTDVGNDISNRIYDLTLLLHAYQDGLLVPAARSRAEKSRNQRK